MTEPRWNDFLERWAAGRLEPLETATVLERLRARETYILAHRQWACGATDLVVTRLLDAAAAPLRAALRAAVGPAVGPEIGAGAEHGERTGEA